MEDTTNITAVKNFLEAQYENDFDRAFANYANTDFSWVVGTADNEELRGMIPWAGHDLKGKDGYIRLTSMLFSEFEPLSFEPQKFTDGGASVFVEGHFKFRHRTTAKIAESDFIGRFDMRDGKISGGQFYENTAAVAEARRGA